MDAALKAKWTAALRSGEYTQGAGNLRTLTDHYCCLGVLCAIAEVVPDPEPSFDNCYVYAGFSGDLAPELRTSLGIPSYTMRHLVHLNDGERRSFAEIADYIDANL